jgi:hypothetical protein
LLQPCLNLIDEYILALVNLVLRLEELAAFVSLLNDVTNDMIMPPRPVFLSATLGAGLAAFGPYHIIVGILALPGAVWFGEVWQHWGLHTAFTLSAAFTILAAGVLGALARCPGTGPRPSLRD